MAVAYDPAQWGDFAVALAGAAAALCGLAFVAISFNLENILADKVLPSRAADTLILLASPLVIALLLLVPGQSSTALGIEFALLTLALAVWVLRLDLPRFRLERDGGNPMSWRLAHLVPGMVITSCIGIGAVGMLTTSVGALYWIAGAALVSLIFGLANCWVLLVEIKR